MLLKHVLTKIQPLKLWQDASVVSSSFHCTTVRN